MRRHVGDLVRATLARDGVDTRALLVDPPETARSVKLMYRDGRRRMIVVVGVRARGCAPGIPGQVRRFPPVHDDRPVVDTDGAG